MNYESFKVAVLDRLSEDISDPKCIQIRPVHRNNGEQLDGLVILEGDVNIGPTLYLNHYYRRFLSGSSFSTVYRQIVDNYERNKTAQRIDVRFFTDFSRIRPRILAKLINREKNRELLESGVPYLPFLDLAIVFTCLFPVDPEIGNATILVDGTHLSLWDQTVDTLFPLAMENTRRQFAPRLSDINHVLTDLLEQTGDEPVPIEENPLFPMYVLTNAQNLFGAVCMTYEGLLQRYAARFSSGFYILPSSIHELILVPSRENDRMEDFSRMVREVNETQVAPEDILSDHAYYYSLEEEEVFF